MREAMAECGHDGVEPTRANVLERIGEYKGKEVTKSLLRNWTRTQAEWSPIQTDGSLDGILVDLDQQAMLEDW